MKSLLCIGINHRTAPLALREKFAWEPVELRAYMQRLAAGSADEVIVLNTCNRVEAYFAGTQVSRKAPMQTLATTAGVPQGEFIEKAYHLEDKQTIQHLFQVVSGLDSMAVGEHQILGQVARAYEFARECGTTGKQLSKLFQAALACGKRVQTETLVNQLDASVPSMAVKLAAKQIPDLTRANVLLVGAGDMAELAVQAFCKRGVTRFAVASRTLESAQKLATSLDATADVLDNMPKLIQQADIILASTSAPSYLLTKEMLQTSVEARKSTPLVILDIAVPRDVDPAARQLTSVHLYDIDDLQDQASDFKMQRQTELRKAQKLIEDEVDKFRDYLQEQSFVPLIKRVRSEAESIRRTELERALRNMPNVDAENLEQIDWLTRSIVKKLLHHPTVHLRKQATSLNGNTDVYAEWVMELFGLDQK